MNIRIITASAGSGKTTHLAQLLDAAVGEGSAEPERIVATTFTKQAAAEIMERARARLLRSGRGDRAHQLLAARIGTVNSVCGSFASDFAFELGLSPELRVLDEAAAETELNRSLAAVVSAEIADELQRFPARFDRKLDWRYEVRRLIEAARSNGLSAEELRACAARSSRALDDCLGPLEPDGDAIDDALANAIESALVSIDLAVDATKTTKKYVEWLEKRRRDLDRGRLRWGDWAKLAGGSLPAKKSAAHAGPVIAAASRHLGHPRLRAELHRLIELVYSVAAGGLDAYQRHKRERGVIDYVDQETLALELLRRPDVRAALEGQIDLVLVDEFQDTSPIQLAIFLQLASLASESVWVGDPKQAIYGFRGTDPKLMDAAIESLTSPANDPELVSDAVDAIGAQPQIESLSRSYRSRPELVHLTSDVFAEAFASQGMPPERVRLEPQMTSEPEGLGRCVEVWPLRPSGRTNKTELSRCLAAGVSDLLDRQPLVRDRDEGGTHLASPADIAVLCRTNEQCQLVADALTALGIEAVVPRMGLLDTAEARTVIAGLHLWLDPRDSLAAAELARLISFPDADDELIRRVFDAPGVDAFAADATVRWVLDARGRQPDLGVLETVDAVATATRARQLAAGWGNAVQRAANLDALRGHAQEYVNEAAANRDAPTLAGLLAYLDHLVDDSGWYQSRSDSQALIGDSDAVTVSTWHRAKGLEWPITVLYGLEALRAPSCYGVHVVSDRERFDVQDPLAERWVRFWPSPYSSANQGGPVKEACERSPAFGEIVDRADREALRVLYVGWTRARDRLVFAAAANKMTGGLLGKLEAISPSLISEPSSEVPGAQVVEWAGREIDAWVSPASPTTPAASRPLAGSMIGGRAAPPDYAPARLSPSSAEPIPCSLKEIVELGARLPLAGERVDVEQLGNAVHGFLACDFAEASRHDRLERARQLLDGYGVAVNLAAEDALEAGDRLWRWIGQRYGHFRVHRELPVAERLASGTVVAGTADLVLIAGEGFVLIDHKTFPGAFEQARERVLQYSGQLAAYASAIEHATGRGCLSSWIHLPVLGRMVEVCAR